MRIIVRAKSNAKVERVEEIGPQEVTVLVKEPPREGRANEAIVRALAGHFHVRTAQVRLVAGFTSRQKVFEVDA